MGGRFIMCHRTDGKAAKQPESFSEMLEVIHSPEAWSILKNSNFTEFLFELQHEQEGLSRNMLGDGDYCLPDWVKLDRRLWLKQQRRAIDLSSLQHQDETWTFEIDWRFVKAVADRCGIRLDRSNPSTCRYVPFPVLGIRRFVATDYSCVDDDGKVIAMTHRRTNDAFAALMMTYQLYCKLPQEVSEQYSDNRFYEIIFDLWKKVLDLGGNYPIDEQVRRQYAQELCRLELVNELAKMLPEQGTLEQMFPVGPSEDGLGAKFGQWRTAYDKRSDKGQSFLNQFLKGSRWTLKNSHDTWNDLTRKLSDAEWNLDRDRSLQAITAVASCDAISKYYTEHYPVMICVPTPDNFEGCSTYTVRVHRHGESDLHLCEELDRLHRTRQTQKKLRDCADDDGAPCCARYMADSSGWLKTMLRFKRFSHTHAMLRDSAFLIAKLPKDIRAVQIRDRGSDGVSVTGGDGIYSSLHIRYSNPTNPRVKPCSSLTTQCWLIPRFRCVAPFLAFLPTQVALLLMYLHMTDGLQRTPEGTPNGMTAFLTIVAVQIGVAVLIGAIAESGVLTRVMRVPRFCSVMMVPLNLWMTCNVTVYRSPVQILLGWRYGGDYHEVGGKQRIQVYTVDEAFKVFSSLSDMQQWPYLAQETACLLAIVILAYFYYRSYYRSYLIETFTVKDVPGMKDRFRAVLKRLMPLILILFLFALGMATRLFIGGPQWCPQPWAGRTYEEQLKDAVAGIPALCTLAVVVMFVLLLLKCRGSGKSSTQRPLSMMFLLVPSTALFLFGSYHGSYGLVMPLLVAVLMLVGLCLWLGCYLAMRFTEGPKRKGINSGYAVRESQKNI